MRKLIFTSCILLFLVVVVGCNPKAEFIKNKSGTENAFVGSVHVPIKSYLITYNPKSNGYVKLVLETKAEYEAKSVDGGSFAAIQALLKEQNVRFDTSRQELSFSK